MTHGPKPTAPTSDELAAAAKRLLDEADAALSGSHFAIINHRTPGTLHRYYDAAALRHCCQLLAEIENASAAGQELTVRVLGRAFIEAWLTALYIHFGGDEALERVAQDTLHQVKLSDNDLKDFDQRLQRDKGKATARAAKIRHDNAGITRRNAANPAQLATPLRAGPYIPRLTPTGIDISKRITEDFNGITSRSLPLTEITDRLTQLGPEKASPRRPSAPSTSTTGCCPPAPSTPTSTSTLGTPPAAAAVVGPAHDERCVVLSLSCGARLRPGYPQHYCTLRMPVARPAWRYRRSWRPGNSRVTSG
jgi:prefoldin subunit 5